MGRGLRAVRSRLNPQMGHDDELGRVLRKVKQAAVQYRKLTGRHLGVTAEIAEYEAALLLDGVELLPWGQAGYDAIRKGNRKRTEKLQIKGRLCRNPVAPHGARASSWTPR